MLNLVVSCDNCDSCFSVISSYEKSFGSSTLRACYWAIESAAFVKSLMMMLVEEEKLPSELDIRGWLFLNVESYEISEVKHQVLLDGFRCVDDQGSNAALYEEDLSLVPVFILTVVKTVINLPGVRDDLSFVRSVFSMPCLSFVAEDVLLDEIRIFTDVLVDLGRITRAEQGRMERGFLDFLVNIRRDPGLAGRTEGCSVIDLLRHCSSGGAQNLLRSVLCLDGGVQSRSSLCCDGFGQLSSDVTSCVCAVILAYLSANHIQSYDSVSGPLLEEVTESHRRLVNLAELDEGMLWDDIGIVAGEDYRLQLYAKLGYTLSGERAASPEIGN